MYIKLTICKRIHSYFLVVSLLVLFPSVILTYHYFVMAPNKGKQISENGEQVQTSLLFLPHTRQWNESQERLEKSLGESLRNVAREQAQKYFQQKYSQQPAIVEPNAFAASTSKRQVAEGMSDVAVKVGPLAYKLYAKYVKQHFAMVGIMCRYGPLRVAYASSTRCKTHGWHTFVSFRTAAEADIALGLDDDDEEENCSIRHEIYDEMIPVTRAPASLTCCESAVRV